MTKAEAVLALEQAIAVARHSAGSGGDYFVRMTPVEAAAVLGYLVNVDDTAKGVGNVEQGNDKPLGETRGAAPKSLPDGPRPASRDSLHVSRRSRRRYCEMCDKWVPAAEKECRACGADTVKAEA
jgi:hypothetical protein